MSWGTGMMEYWNTGFGGMRSAFHTQYSIVPPFHHSKDYLTANTTPTGEKSKPGSWGQDSLLRREIADEL
jgi:hypothetical protein